MRTDEVKAVICYCGNVMECVGETCKGIINYRCECGFEVDLKFEVKE